MTAKQIRYNIIIAKEEARQSNIKSVHYANTGHEKSAIVYAIRHEALLCYIAMLKNKLKIKSCKQFKKENMKPYTGLKLNEIELKQQNFFNEEKTL